MNMRASINHDLSSGEQPVFWGEINISPVSGQTFSKLTMKIGDTVVVSYFDIPEELIHYCQEHKFDVKDNRLKVAA